MASGESLVKFGKMLSGIAACGHMTRDGILWGMVMEIMNKGLTI